MDRLELLRSLSFGAQVAEEETNELAEYFVEVLQRLLGDALKPLFEQRYA